MEYNKKRNHEYVKANIPSDRLIQYVRDIRLELLEEIESKAQEFIFKHIEEYGVEIVEGNAEALDDLRVWLAEKKVEINTIK